MSALNLSSMFLERARVGANLDNIAKQAIPLDKWWGVATPEKPRLAYERFLEATRLAVELAYTRDGEAVGFYAAQANGEDRLAISFLADFLRAAKIQKRMPRWWNMQHDLCMFRLAFVEDGQFYVFHAVEVSDVRKKWGYKTSKLLVALATAIYGDYGVKFRYDELLSGVISIAIKKTPARETGSGIGFDKPCRWGVECKRRDCWFKHPRLELPEENVQTRTRYDGVVCSTTNLLEHMIQLVDDDESKLQEMYRLYELSVGVDRTRPARRANVSEAIESQKELRKVANSGDIFAMYLFGKILKDVQMPLIGKQQSHAARKAEAVRLWTASSLAGNAYAMAALARTHRDAGHLPTAVHWWRRALKHAEFPEAAYDLGVSYGLNEHEGSDEVPINYDQAAMYYAMVVDMDLGYMTVDMNSLGDETPLAGHVLCESLSNSDQAGYQKLASANLLVMEKYLGNPTQAPLEDHKELSPFVQEGADAYVCLLCSRHQRVGEKRMMSCSKCHSAYYCNAICQRGHWPSHKLECGTAS